MYQDLQVQEVYYFVRSQQCCQVSQEPCRGADRSTVSLCAHLWIPVWNRILLRNMKDECLVLSHICYRLSRKYGYTVGKLFSTVTAVRSTCASQISPFIHLLLCLTTGPKPLPNRALHIVWSRASSFKWEYPLLSLRSSSSFLRLLPHLPVTSIPPFIVPSITRCRRQFLHKSDQSSWPSVYLFHVVYSSSPWL